MVTELMCLTQPLWECFAFSQHANTNYLLIYTVLNKVFYLTYSDNCVSSPDVFFSRQTSAHQQPNQPSGEQAR